MGYWDDKEQNKQVEVKLTRISPPEVVQEDPRLDPALTLAQIKQELSLSRVESKTIRRKKKQKKFLEAFSQNAVISDGLLSAEISRTTLFKWLQVDLKFRQKFINAQESGADAVDKELWNRAMVGETVRIYKRGELVKEYQRKSDLLLMFVAKGMRPLKYKDKVETETTDRLKEIEAELQRLGVTIKEENKGKVIEAKVTRVSDCLPHEAEVLEEKEEKPQEVEIPKLSDLPPKVAARVILGIEADE